MDSQTADSSPPLGRPVAGTEYSWCRAVPVGTGVTVLALLLSRPVSCALLQSTVRHLQSSHPVLSCRLTASPANPNHPFLSAADSAPVELLSVSAADVLPAPEAQPPLVSPFHYLLEHEMNQNPWADPEKSTPLFFATVYEMPDADRQVLTLRFHTGVCDRTSAVSLLVEFLDLFARPMQEGDETNKRRREGEILPGIEDLMPKQDSWKPFWAKGKDLLGYSINGLRTATLPFEDVDSRRRSEVVRWVMSVEETTKLLNACKTRGIKLCAAISAAAMIASHSSKQYENGQGESYSVVTLIDCRKYLCPILHNHNVGFYHSAIVNTHHVHGGEELWQVATRCQSSYAYAMNNKKHLKDVGDLNYLMCKAIENPQLTPSSSLRTALISVFEETMEHESSQLRKLGVEDYVGCASSHGVGPSIAVFDTIQDGQLNCACVYPSPLHSRKQIHDILQHMKTILIDDDHMDNGPQEGLEE